LSKKIEKSQISKNKKVKKFFVEFFQNASKWIFQPFL